MQKNWYIIYTRPNAEKKVSTALARRKIESYVPMNSKSISHAKKTKIQKKPLFQSYVFANISEAEIPFITSLHNFINFVYWKQHPVNLTNEEILLIKEFTTNYTDIKVQKIEVNINNSAKAIDVSQRSFSGNVLTIKNTITKVIFPKIGVCIFAETENEKMLHAKVISSPKFTRLPFRNPVN